VGLEKIKTKKKKRKEKEEAFKASSYLIYFY
jgi:hypothetical protein